MGGVLWDGNRVAIDELVNRPRCKVNRNNSKLYSQVLATSLFCATHLAKNQVTAPSSPHFEVIYLVLAPLTLPQILNAPPHSFTSWLSLLLPVIFFAIQAPFQDSLLLFTRLSIVFHTQGKCCAASSSQPILDTNLHSHYGILALPPARSQMPRTLSLLRCRLALSKAIPPFKSL